MTNWSPSQETAGLVHAYMEALFTSAPEIMGTLEMLAGCEVTDTDPIGVGAVIPRYMEVRINDYKVHALWRGAPVLVVTDYCTVLHFREGNRYEIIGASGSSGVATPPIHDHSSNTEGGQNLRQILEHEFEDATELTINAGVITRTQVYHRVDTQADAATDNLDTINGGTEGDVLILRAENDARTVVVRHNAGNIWFLGADDVSLANTEDHVVLVYDGANWCGLAGGGGAILAVHDHSNAASGGQNLRDILEFETAASTELTIAAGAVTRTQVYHRIDTQGDAAADDLDTINGGVVGDLLIIRAENNARTVVVRHQTGNIWIFNEDDIELEDIEDHLWLIYDGANWCSVGAGTGDFVIPSGAAFPVAPDDNELFIRTDLGAMGFSRLYRYEDAAAGWLAISDGPGILRSEIHEHAVNEDHSAACNGVKTVFLTANEFEPESLAVYLNKSREQPVTDYTELATYDGFTTVGAPAGVAILMVDYILA